MSRKQKRLTAYHEVGHALVSSVLPNADPVHKISIISRGRAAVYTLKLPFEDSKIQSKKEFLDDIAGTLGGYVAEELVFGDITTGPSNDLAVITALARDMVSRYGMSDKIGPVAFATDQNYRSETYSQDMASQIDSEVSRIIEEAREKAKGVLVQHREALTMISERLFEVETLEREEFEKLLILNGIEPKKKEDEDLPSIPDVAPTV
jgi:cell division protease FtsH